MLQNLKIRKYVNIASMVTMSLAAVSASRIVQDSIDDDLLKIVEYVKGKGWSNGHYIKNLNS